MTRPRACGALIEKGAILMVQHREPTRTYWTLPGGGLEAGETPAEAAEREVWEETGLRVLAARLLWEGAYGHGAAVSAEYCFLMERPVPADPSAEAVLGRDPEEAHLPLHQRLLQGVSWMPLADMGQDPQVARVILALTAEASADSL